MHVEQCQKHSAKSWHHMVWNWTAEMHEWCARMVSSSSWLLMCGCVWWALLFAHAGAASVSVLCCVLFVPCVSPLASPPPPSREVWVIACPWVWIVLVLLLHCSRVGSLGGVPSSVFLSLTPCCFCFFFVFFQGYLSFCFPPLNTLEADGLMIYNP